MQRIAILGCAGSGKSTLARQLGSILGLEVIHLDALYWKPGWVETPEAEWRATVEGVAGRESWIIDGNYSRTFDLRLPAADTIVFLDVPRRVCLWRVFKRRVRYAGRSRPDIAPGCPEKIDWAFLRWIWTFPRRRPRVLEALERYGSGKDVVVLRTPSDVRNFLRAVAASRAGRVRGRR